jgi:hypothetical protein
MLVWLLQSQKQVKIERLAATLPLPIQQNSRRRHLQRFLNLNALSLVLLWFPICDSYPATSLAFLSLPQRLELYYLKPMMGFEPTTY